ncbi:hypothetical protein [Bacillus altitudinis]|uniref:hypothetical protein n=1 Tax=Bacillus altitudinis TaxID=293387 RepID=UPI00148EC233|nr:hypothetical protein [Bacillus altitudinis]NOL32672.1 hypothetical protein [Bacillus altitudinis]
MAKQTVIHEVAKVTMKQISTGKVIGSAVTQLTSLAQQVQQDFLKGGWGNKDLYVINSSKEVSGNIRNAFFDLDFMAMQQGVSIENENISVYEDEVLTVNDSNGVTLTKTPIEDSEVTFTNKANGEVYQTVVSGMSYTLSDTFAKKGEQVTVHYLIEVDAETVEINGNKFSENYYLELHTLEYDPVTNKTYSDLYIQLPKVNFSGEFDMSLEAGQAFTPELGYRALADDNGKIGRFARVKRNEDGSKGAAPSTPGNTTPDDSGDLGD